MDSAGWRRWTAGWKKPPLPRRHSSDNNATAARAASRACKACLSLRAKHACRCRNASPRISAAAALALLMAACAWRSRQSHNAPKEHTVARRRRRDRSNALHTAQTPLVGGPSQPCSCCFHHARTKDRHTCARHGRMCKVAVKQAKHAQVQSVQSAEHVLVRARTGVHARTAGVSSSRGAGGRGDTTGTSQRP